MAFGWHDLLGTPWRLHGATPRGLDCSTVAETILRRIGLSPPETSPYRIPGSKGEEGEIAAYLAGMDSFYTRLGDDISLATQTGDIVVVGEEGRSHARGMLVLVEPDRGTFLTALESSGVVAVRRWAITKNPILGVYRPGGGEGAPPC